VETFAALLPGLGFGIDPQGRHNDGSFMLAIDPSAFMPLDEFKGQVEAFVKYLKETPPQEGFTEVLYPGEKEHRTIQQRSRDGITIEDGTWKRISELADRFNVSSLVKTAG
jgi:LDH2 family malate/lactate/ureidoglycolate dehydrogenase